MSIKLSKSSYINLIQGDVQRVESEMSDSIQRHHVVDIIKDSVDHYYPQISQENGSGKTSAELEKNKSLSVVVAQMEYAIGVLKRGLGFSNSFPSGATNNERSAIAPRLTCVGTGKVHSFGNTDRCPVCGGWGKLASIS